ncbi:wax ester/triacylglycerol synthase domain-containing protein [Pseudonocardia acaciae]|uniref:wax ester/triacylglycerol synthase domain-containing protein n=1 Tax=Pseudonocardia acaciae TaxID=551276 RepID=UPI00048C0601|nr:wax ester/triacylglycerol synthase domain-containing protein [Pseudonocardia acaciae]
MRHRVPIERASSADLLQLAAGTGPAAVQTAVILMLGPGSPPSLAAVRSAFDTRVRTVPRLRQRLMWTPPGAGRPVWVDDAEFDIERHVRHVVCPAPGDEAALWDVAAGLVTDSLAFAHPPWAATLVTGLADRRAALVIVFHHVLADGVSGLALLARLLDGAPPGPADRGFPSPPPSAAALYADAWASRARVPGRLRRGLAMLRGAMAGARSGLRVRPSPSSLNRPTGPRRRLAVARADLAEVHAAAHACHATVNDAILIAVAGALGAVLRRRGETVDTLVASVMVSARPDGQPGAPGNRVGSFPVALPATGDRGRRLERVARVTATRKLAARAASSALWAPLVRALAALGLFRWFANHQTLVSTFVTNLRGPTTRQAFLGMEITDIIPVSATAGNVPVVFAALSYAGVLAVTVCGDPDACPDLAEIAPALRAELAALPDGCGPRRNPCGPRP